MTTLMSSIAASALFSAATLTPGQTAAVSARDAIDAGNQAWIDGVKTGNVKRIIATYTKDAVDCGSTGECIRGQLQIERHMANSTHEPWTGALGCGEDVGID
jgi:ketosteroid isomerase-like protein